MYIIIFENVNGEFQPIKKFGAGGEPIIKQFRKSSSAREHIKRRTCGIKMSTGRYPKGDYYVVNVCNSQRY